MKHTHQIISALKIDQARAKEAIDLILTLNPKPGSSVGSSADNVNIIVPDLVVSNDEGRLSVALNNRIPELAIDRSFSRGRQEMDENARKKERRVRNS